MDKKLILALAAVVCSSSFALPVPASSDPYYTGAFAGDIYAPSVELDPEGEVGAGTSPP